MWKTRFEVNTRSGHRSSRSRPLSTSSALTDPYSSRRSPSVPRAREDSPSALVRLSPPSSIPSLDMLIEEEEDDDDDEADGSPAHSINAEQPLESMPIAMPKRHSYPTTNKHSAVLPTIAESNDHEVMTEGVSNNSHLDATRAASVHDRHRTIIGDVPSEDSTTTAERHSNRVAHAQLERNDLSVNSAMRKPVSELTIDKRIAELLHRKNQRHEKSLSPLSTGQESSALITTTVKDMSTFFEKKSLAILLSTSSEQKRMIRAKRTMPARRHMTVNQDDVPRSETGTGSSKDDPYLFHRQMKRIKNVHDSQFGDCAEFESVLNQWYSSPSRASDLQARAMEQEDQQAHYPTKLNHSSMARMLWERSFMLIVLIAAVLTYSHLSSLTDVDEERPRNHPWHLLPRLLEQPPASPIRSNVLSRYGRVVRHRCFTVIDAFVTLLGRTLFRSDTYEYRNHVTYVVTSAYEHLSEWFVHLFK